eukprot:TRINITY_DN13806_c0_g1_i1.p1 TRINITY_DN13806_c0_g1~~TRINITY_DN13806_c0_g1_i1.p1  ORF type:complete len:170 (-),score=43.72 TRINITY_DN13806_c0_g1_i1:155-664(-)
MSYSERTHVLVMGSSASGRTGLICRFVFSEFVESFDPTIKNIYAQSIKVNGESKAIQLEDASNETYWMHEHYFRRTNGLMLVYSVASRESLVELNDLNFFGRCEELRGREIPILLVGNKCDVREEDRRISVEEGETFAKKLGIPFIETSAISGSNVEKAFAYFVGGSLG